jgi:lipopolysaccharide biosynthesis regulator YciM
MLSVQKIFHFVFVYLYIVALTPLTFPQNSSLTPKLEKQILKGLEATFKFNFEKSEKIFDQIIQSHPRKSTGFHFKSIPYLWRFLDNKNDSDLTRFFELSDSTIQKSNDIPDSIPGDPFDYYILGSTYSFRAMAYTRQESYLDAILAAKKSLSNLSNAILNDSTFYDAYMGLGLFNFMIAQTPPALKWAMHITGITGDKEKGLEYLKLAAINGKFSLVESKYYLSQILGEFYAEDEESEKLLKALISKYPKNLLFQYSLSNFYNKVANLKESEKTLQRIISSSDTSFIQLIRYSKLSMGDIYFFRNEFEAAINYYQNFLQDNSENHYRGIAALRLSLCYSFLGDTMRAAEYLEFAKEGNTDIDDDRYANFMSRRLLENPPDWARLKIIFINNLINAGKYTEALDSLLSFPKVEFSNSLLAEINLYLSKVSFFTGSFTDSYSFALSAIENDEGEKWINPFAYYYAALASAELDYLSDAVVYIEKAREYSDYFYENKLANMLNALEYKLGKLGELEP